RATGDMAHHRRKIFVNFLKLREACQLTEALNRAGPAPIAHGDPLNIDNHRIAWLDSVDEHWTSNRICSEDLQRRKWRFSRTRLGVLLPEQVPPIVVRFDYELLAWIDDKLWFEVGAKFSKRRFFPRNSFHVLSPTCESAVNAVCEPYARRLN